MADGEGGLYSLAVMADGEAVFIASQWWLMVMRSLQPRSDAWCWGSLYSLAVMTDGEAVFAASQWWLMVRRSLQPRSDD